MAYYNLTADGTQSGSFLFSDRSADMQVIATGTFGGGTLVLQVQLENGDWVNLPDASYTAAASKTISLKAPMKVRYSLSGATAPDIDLQIN